MKIYERNLKRRIIGPIEAVLSENQCGFRPGQNTRDHIFALKTIINRTSKVKKEVYVGFIDMQKAFN